MGRGHLAVPWRTLAGQPWLGGSLCVADTWRTLAEQPWLGGSLCGADTLRTLGGHLVDDPG